MARELEGYRDVMEDLLTYFGGRRLLYQRDVAAYLGCCPRTAAKLVLSMKTVLHDAEDYIRGYIQGRLDAARANRKEQPVPA